MNLLTSHPYPFFFADKPAGATTHSSLNKSTGMPHPLADRENGFVEYLSSMLDEGRDPLFVCHRLDRDTTGAIVFARTKEAAATLHELFSARKVRKTYLFLTDRILTDRATGESASAFTRESFIERRGNQFISLPAAAASPSSSSPLANARTVFRLIESGSNGIHLWEAKPETGRPHQIRLHAQEAGLPILGDREHGGSPFPALCLHSLSIGFDCNALSPNGCDGETFEYTSPPPIWYGDLRLAGELTRDPLLCRWLASVDRRTRLERSLGTKSETIRLIHSEGDPLRAEKLGDVYSLSWFGENSPTDQEWASIRRLTELCGWHQWYLQERGNRGRTPNEESLHFGCLVPPRWIASENGVLYEFRTDSGLSPGLFLDQRRNRRWVRENSCGLKVLNLFCYTGGFSVAAALGGASQTVSVDVSRVFLDWTKRNFELNRIPLESGSTESGATELARHEFRAMDSREYLAWAKKKGLRFDLIVCDPPSFGRSKAGVFKIEKDFASLLDSLLDITSPGGRILFASNFEQWTLEEFGARSLAVARDRGQRISLAPTPSPDWDFELPRSQSSSSSTLQRPRGMKSWFIMPKG